MSAPSLLLPATVVDAVGQALLAFTWQGTAIGLAAALLLRVLRHDDARRRHAVCCAALLLCVLAPAWQVAAALAGPAAPAATAWPWQLELAARLPAVVAAWSLGAALMSARLALGWCWVQRLRRGARAVPARWQSAQDRLALRLGAPAGIALRCVERLAAPVTIGWWRPVVLVPAALLTQMPPALLEALLAHELAHVARRDYLVNLLQSVVEALLFFHPAVWWLSARLRAERELVADDLAARAIGDRRRLAQALHALSLAPEDAAAAGAAWAVPARGGSLLRRVEVLVAPPLRATGWRPALAATLVMGASLAAQWPQPPHAAAAVLAERAPRMLTPAARLLSLPASVSARHALLLDEASGRVLMSRDADAVVPVASLTKLMTAMVVLDAGLDPDAALRIAPADVDADPGQPGAPRLVAGARLTRGAALTLALMASSNRAAAALARTYPGGPAAFEQAVQDKIRVLGLRHTTLVDPTGLATANASTATEMARIVAAAARNPQIAAITGERASEVVVDGRVQRLHNLNPFVGEAGWDIRLSKTGFTRAAGGCLTLRLHAGGQDLTLVLLGATDSGQRLRDAAAIQDALAPFPAT